MGYNNVFLHNRRMENMAESAEPTEIVVNVADLVNVGAESNIRGAIVDNQLILVIDLTAPDLGLSSTGKTLGVASTHGFTKFLREGLTGNIYIGRKVKPPA
jgi:hypothetical protein